MTKTDLCRWCGKPYAAHLDKPSPLATPRMPCAGLKSGFLKDIVDGYLSVNGMG